MSHVTVPRCWEGGIVACLATGPSLNQEDVDYLRGKVDGIIAVNDAWKLAPFADWLMSSDRRWYTHYKGVPGFKGVKYSIGSSVGKRNPYVAHPDIRVLKNGGYDGLSLDQGELRNGRNSGYAALGLSVLSGASTVVLLGYNLGVPVGKPHHFWGNHPQGLSQNASLFVGWRRIFHTMVEPLKALNVQVINCTANTSLDAFTQANLRDVLQPVAEQVAS